MRKQTSLFNRACEFINDQQRGDSFLTRDYIAAIGHWENVTSWKRYSKNKHYNCHQYKGYLKRAGFISQVKRGEWRIEEYIPHWFDFGHLSILLGYHKWDTESRKDITTYKGMSKQNILDKLKNQVNENIPNTAAMRIPQNSTYGNRIATAAANSSAVRETARNLANLINEKVDEVAKSKNYNSTVNKINISNDPRVERNSTTQNTMAETTKTSETHEFTKNIVLLESAFDLVGKCTTSDRFMQARLYNVQVLLQDITSAFSEKKDFLTRK